MRKGEGGTESSKGTSQKLGDTPPTVGTSLTEHSTTASINEKFAQVLTEVFENLILKVPHEALSLLSKLDLFGYGWFGVFFFCCFGVVSFLFACLFIFSLFACFTVKDLECCIPVSIE